MLQDESPGLLQHHVVRVQSSSEGAAGVARRRLDVDLFEPGFPEDLVVGDAVQANTTRDAELREPSLLPQLPGDSEKNILGHLLNACGHIRIILVAPKLRGTGWVRVIVQARLCRHKPRLRRPRLAEQVNELPPIALLSVIVIAEVRHIEMEASVTMYVDEFVDLVD